GEDCLRETNGYWLFYGKGTINNLTTGTSITASINNTNSGWLVGAGIEWAFAPNWSAKVEYNYLGLDDRTFIVPAGVPRMGGRLWLKHLRQKKEQVSRKKRQRPPW